MTGIMQALLGSKGTSLVIPLPGGSYLNSVTDPTDAAVSITFNANGTVGQSGGVGTPGNWSANPPDRTYEIRATVSAGTAPSSGVVNTWLSFPQTWTNNQTVVGTKTSTLLIEIRDAASGAVMTSGSYSITANVAA